MDSAGYIVTHYSWAEGLWIERPFIDGVHVTELVSQCIHLAVKNCLPKSEATKLDTKQDCFRSRMWRFT